MPTFRCRVAGADGKVLQLRLQAPDKSSVVRELHASGRLPIRIEHERLQFDWRALIASSGKGSHAKPSDIARLLDDLATLLGAGVTLDHALRFLAETSESSSLRGLAAKLAEQLRSGSSLVAALSAHGSGLRPEHLAILRAGEISGSLEAALQEAEYLMERTAKLRSKIVSTLIYPAILLITAAGSIVVLLTFVIPSFRPMFESYDVKLPLATRLVLAAGTALETHGVSFLVLSLAMLLSFRVALVRPVVRSWCDRQVLATPFVGTLLGRIELARFARTLGTCLKNGIPILNALELARGTLRNSAIRSAIAKAQTAVAAGRSLSKPLLEADIFPLGAVRLLQVGEESGRLDEMLLKTADVCEAEFEKVIERMLTVLAPALTLLIGALVAFIVAAILLALLSINELAVR